MSIIVTILHFIVCFAAGYYLADSQVKARKIKKLEEDCAMLRAAKAELDKIKNPTPEQLKEVIVRTTAPCDSSTITCEVLQKGIEKYDRILIKAPGRKDRVALLRPWTRKMAKVKQEEKTEVAQEKFVGRQGRWAKAYHTLGIDLVPGEKFKVQGVSQEGNYSVLIHQTGGLDWYVEPHCVHESLLSKPVKIKPTRPSRKK